EAPLTSSPSTRIEEQAEPARQCVPRPSLGPRTRPASRPGNSPRPAPSPRLDSPSPRHYNLKGSGRLPAMHHPSLPHTLSKRPPGTEGEDLRAWDRTTLNLPFGPSAGPQATGKARTGDGSDV